MPPTNSIRSLFPSLGTLRSDPLRNPPSCNLPLLGNVLAATIPPTPINLPASEKPPTPTSTVRVPAIAPGPVSPIIFRFGWPPRRLSGLHTPQYSSALRSTCESQSSLSPSGDHPSQIVASEISRPYFRDALKRQQPAGSPSQGKPRDVGNVASSDS
jgi:hypothetical protein